MFFELRVWWDAMVLTVQESLDRHLASRKVKEDRDESLSKMLDLID